MVPHIYSISAAHHQLLLVLLLQDGPIVIFIRGGHVGEVKSFDANTFITATPEPQS